MSETNPIGGPHDVSPMVPVLPVVRYDPVGDAKTKMAELAARLNPVSPRPPRRSVWYSSKGPDVEELQHLLEKTGLYSVAEGDIPGVFGPATEAATRAFQTAHGLRPDALCGPVTWERLDEAS